MAAASVGSLQEFYGEGQGYRLFAGRVFRSETEGVKLKCRKS